MHKIKVRNLKRNEVGKFDPEIAGWRNPYKAVIKFDDLLKLPELAHYDGTDDCWILTATEYEALTSGKNLSVPETVLDRLEGFGMQLADYIKSLRTKG